MKPTGSRTLTPSANFSVRVVVQIVANVIVALQYKRDTYDKVAAVCDPTAISPQAHFGGSAKMLVARPRLAKSVAPGSLRCGDWAAVVHGGKEGNCAALAMTCKENWFQAVASSSEYWPEERLRAVQDPQESSVHLAIHPVPAVGGQVGSPALQTREDRTPEDDIDRLIGGNYENAGTSVRDRPKGDLRVFQHPADPEPDSIRQLIDQLAQSCAD